MNSLSQPKVIVTDQIPESQVDLSTGVLAERSRLDPGWVARSLASVKRMHEDEEYRLSIAKMLS